MLHCVREDAWTSGAWSPAYDLPEVLKPTSIGERVRLKNLRATRVIWLLPHGGAWIFGRAYDHAQVPHLVRGTTTESAARLLLGGEPVRRDEYEDGTHELVWSYRTQRLSTSVTLRFGRDSVLRAFVRASPEHLGLRRDPASLARPDGEPPRAPRLLRTIELTEPAGGEAR